MDKTEQAWRILSQKILHHFPFAIHIYLFSLLYPHWRSHPETAPAWVPDSRAMKNTHLWQCMEEKGMKDRQTFQHFSVTHYEDFWKDVIQKLGIIFKQAYTNVCDLSQGIEKPQWFTGAKINIIDSCFNALPETTALIYEDNNKNLQYMSYGELNILSNRIANSLLRDGLQPQDPIAIAMPMTANAVAIYLGIIKMGGVVVSIADSFSSQEIATRLRITKSKAIFTQDVIVHSNKKIPLYEKIIAAQAPKTILIPCDKMLALPLRKEDCLWENFLSKKADFDTYACNPMDACNILFSSGTSADPKAIPWNHTTAIKAASDAFFHHNIQAGDILAWPTNLGWMMGPWLIFAALIHHATIALYTDTPKDRAFGEFIQNAKVTMLGVVPTLVAAWRQSQCMQGLDWQNIKLFSSTGECSNAEDMLYLMSLAHYKPIIEYCGGTEIGGAYITSSLLDKNYPSLFTTPAMGINFVLLDEQGHVSDSGEVALIPPALGLSTELLNADHHQIYFADMPETSDGKKLRRHGDQIKRYLPGTYSLLGRTDDTMKLGGIKVAAAEIERVLAGLPGTVETAAIAITPHHQGPSQLIIFAVVEENTNKEKMHSAMQKKIREKLNPLFKIYDVVFVNELPKTASNKIMRRALRKIYEEKKQA